MFKQYRRISISEMQEWQPVGAPTHKDEVQYLLDQDISISAADLNNGSPKPGDMIARSPSNPNDSWLVNKEYFEQNFEEV